VKFFKRFTPCKHEWVRISERVNKWGERRLYIDVKCKNCNQEAKSWNAAWKIQMNKFWCWLGFHSWDTNAFVCPRCGADL